MGGEVSCVVFFSFRAYFAAATVSVLALGMVWEYRCLGLMDDCVGVKVRHFGDI